MPAQPRNRRLQRWLYRSSLVVLILVFIVMLVATPIDTILQSESSGQFWDAIIVVVAYVTSVVAIIFICIARLLNVKRSLSDMPRRFVGSADDLSERSIKRIRDELARCAKIVEDTMPPDSVSHPGLLNPDLTGTSLEDAPTYDEVVMASQALLENKVRLLQPALARPRGMPLREYMLMLESCQFVDWSDKVSRFVELYEQSRFSGRPLMETEFNDFMEAFLHTIYRVRAPADDSGLVSLTSMSPQARHMSVPSIHMQSSSGMPSAHYGHHMSHLRRYSASTSYAAGSPVSSPHLAPWDPAALAVPSRLSSRDYAQQASSSPSGLTPYSSYFDGSKRFSVSGNLGYPLSQLSSRVLSPQLTRQSYSSQYPRDNDNDSLSDDQQSLSSVIIHRPAEES